MTAPPAALAPRRTAGGASLADLFDPRRNALTALRLGLAATVALTHALVLSRGWQPLIGSTRVGDLAVDAFFVLSGFLVTASFLRATSWRRYCWHRVLRIMPAFWVCLALTALVFAPSAAVLSGGTPLAVHTTGAEPAWRYALVNAGLQIQQFTITGLGPDGREGYSANGSLWTLFYEAVCYGIVLVLGVLGVLRRHRWLVLVAVGLLWALVVAASAGLEVVSQERMVRLALAFLLGSAALLYQDRVPMTWPAAAASLLVLAVALLVLPDYQALGAVPFAHLCLWLVVRLPVRWEPGYDLSYGVYIYHWPVIQLLVLAGIGALAAPLFVAVALVAATAAGALSWRFVEHPALRHKDAGFVDRLGVRGGRQRRAAADHSSR